MGSDNIKKSNFKNNSKKKFNIFSFLLNVLILCCGNALYALAVDLFVVPSGMVMGGITGVAIMLNKLLPFNISYMVFAMNIILFIIGSIILGKHFMITTAASSFLYPIFLELFDRILTKFPQINEYMNSVHGDYILCALIAGLMIGVAVGILVRIGASTGGSDIPPMIMNKLTGLSVGIGMLITNVAIVAIQLFASDLQQALYGIIVIVVYSYVIDQVSLAGKGMVQLTVISDKTDEIRNAILTQSRRGVTLISAKKGVSGEKSELVMSVVYKRQLAFFKKLILLEDPSAFIIINRISEVNGNGFSYFKNDKALDTEDIKHI